jgi:hypothetical protein
MPVQWLRRGSTALAVPKGRHPEQEMEKRTSYAQALLTSARAVLSQDHVMS